jgi:hypothetical protein
MCIEAHPRPTIQASRPHAIEQASISAGINTLLKSKSASPLPVVSSDFLHSELNKRFLLNINNSQQKNDVSMSKTQSTENVSHVFIHMLSVLQNKL